MATVTSGPMATTGISPPITPPHPALKAKKQVPETPIKIRLSARVSKPTERGAKLNQSQEAKVQEPEPPVTPSRSPRHVAVGEEKDPKSDAAGKSDPDRTVSPPGSHRKITLRFSPEQVLRAFGPKKPKSIPLSPSPPGEAEPVKPVPAPAPKKPTEAKATSKVQPKRKTAKTPESQNAENTPSMTNLEAPETSGSDVPSIENAAEDGSKEGTVQSKATAKATPKKRAPKPKKPAPTPKKKSAAAIKKAKSKPVPATASAEATSSDTSSKTPAANSSAKEVPNPAPASKKRAHGTAQAVTENDTEKISAKRQKFSPLGHKNVVAPEPVVEAVELGPDELELTAWLFAYGKEGSESYMRKKFPECNFEGYGLGKLSDFKFILHSDAYAKAIASPGSEIHGAIWKIPEKIRATFEKKALKHGMKYMHIPAVQPMHTHPDFDHNPWGAPYIPHAEPLKCWMGVAEELVGTEELGKIVATENFFKRRGLSAFIMEMELAGVPQVYFDKYTRVWVPRPRFGGLDTGYHVDHKKVKPAKKSKGLA